jgi:iron-sulfur cluster assembly protein
MGITITSKAAVKAQHLIKERNLNTDSYLRMSVKGGGCSGYSYNLTIDDKPKLDEDIEFNSNGIRLVTNDICLVYLDGTEIDYVDNLIGGGFKFNNPNASRQCGCGKSFGV